MTTLLSIFVVVVTLVNLVFTSYAISKMEDLRFLLLEFGKMIGTWSGQTRGSLDVILNILQTAKAVNAVRLKMAEIKDGETL